MAKILTAVLLASITVDTLAKSITGKELDVAADILEINTQLSASKEDLANVLVELKEALATNAEFEKQIEALSKTPAAKAANTKELSFKHEKEEFGFVFAKMNHKGHWITAEMVATDKTLQKELVEMGSGMLVKK